VNGLEMKYFVLKPRGNDIYAVASRLAMQAYAATVDRENPILAASLRAWIDVEANEAYKEVPKK
jgi:hypothetical protein